MVAINTDPELPFLRRRLWYCWGRFRSCSKVNRRNKAIKKLNFESSPVRY